MHTLNLPSPELYTLLDALPVLILDQQLVVQYCSNSLANRIGQPKTSFLGQPLTALKGFSCDDTALADRAQRLSTGQSLEHTITLENRLGSSAPYRLSLQTIATHQAGYFMALITDNAQQQTLTQRLNASEQALETLNQTLHKTLETHQKTIDNLHWALTERAEARQLLLSAQKTEVLGRMTAGVAHDFNNILGIILGNTELANEEVSDRHYNNLPAYLQQIETATLRGAALVRKMMQYCRQHNRNLDGTLIDPLPVIEETASLMLSSLPASIELLLELQPVPPTALDNSELSQIVTNLVINARDAINGNGWIQLKLHTTTPPGDTFCTDCGQHINANTPNVAGTFVCLSVGDNGSGIAADQLPHIFDPFYTTKPVDKGTGLGLSVISGIVHEAGGHIVVNTQPAQGTRFNILMPLPPDSATPSVDDSVSANTLLLVDDDVDMLNLMHRGLQKRGYQIDYHDSPQAALKAFRQQPSAYRAAITDFNMPELNGIQLAAELQTFQPGLLVLICSGQEVKLPPDLVNTHFLPKPFTISQLQQLLECQDPSPR